MKQMINTKELCKLIRLHGKRGSLIWTREESQHFITNRHFLVRFEEMPRDVLAALFGAFYKLPEIGQTIVLFGGDENEGAKPIDYKGIYEPGKRNIEGEITQYCRDMGGNSLYRVLKFPESIVLIDERYAKLSAEFSTGEKPMVVNDSPFSAVYLADGNLLVLPMRATDDPKAVNELIGAVNS